MLNCSMLASTCVFSSHGVITSSHTFWLLYICWFQCFPGGLRLFECTLSFVHVANCCKLNTME